MPCFLEVVHDFHQLDCADFNVSLAILDLHQELGDWQVLSDIYATIMGHNFQCFCQRDIGIALDFSQELHCTLQMLFFLLILERQELRNQ